MFYSQTKRWFPHVTEPVPATLVLGPGASTDRAIATWNGITGTLLRDNPNARITAAAGLILDAVTGYISVGLLPATAGIIRIPFATGIYSRNATDTDNIRIILTATTGVNNNLLLGDSATPTQGDIIFDASTRNFAFRAGGGQPFDVTPSLNLFASSYFVLNSGCYLQLNGSAGLVPTAGDLRISSIFTVYSRNTPANTVNHKLLETGPGLLGGTLCTFGNGLATFLGITVRSQTEIRLIHGGSNYFYITGTYNWVECDLRFATGVSVDCVTNGAYLKPRRLSQAAAPTPDGNELMNWNDSSLGQFWLVYEDPIAGTRSVQLT